MGIEMKIIDTDISEVKIIKPDIYKDDRGCFYESYNYKNFKKFNNVIFKQDNESISRYGVLRGLHFQKHPHGQAKLVRAVKGTIQDVAVDIRPESKTYKKYVSIELSDINKYQLFIPDGFAHGFLVLSDEAIVSYKVNDFYNKEFDSGYKYNDPSINIKWNLDEANIILSDKDKNLPFII